MLVIKAIFRLGIALFSILSATHGVAQVTGYTTLKLPTLNTNLLGWSDGASYYGLFPSGQILVGVPFQLQSDPSGNNAFVGVGQIDIASDVFAATHVYTLINTAGGVQNAKVGTLTFLGSAGTSHTVELIEGGNVRDHYYGNYVNTTTDSYVSQAVFGNNTRGRAHLDMQAFELPAAFHNQTLTSVIFNSTGGSRGNPFIAGITAAVKNSATDVVLDTVPNPVSFSPVTGVAPESAVSSNLVIVTGINAPTAIVISGGEYSINGGTWTSAAGTVSLGNRVRVRLIAPAGYSATGTATLTIGGVSASFNVSTRGYAKVTAATQVFTNPQTAEVTDAGIIRFRTVPNQAVTLSSTALENAVVRIDDQQTLSVVSQQSTLRYTPATDSTLLQVRAVNGSPGLVPIVGKVVIAAPAAQSIIPVTADSSGSAKLLTTQANAQVIAGRDEERNVVVAVTNGLVTYQASSGGRALPASFTVYPGETVVADEAGSAGRIRVGSFAQDGSQDGDYFATIPRFSTTLKVPRITTATSQRFGRTWASLVGQALANKLNLGNFKSISQDSASGVMTLVTNRGNHRFLPIGSLALADGALGNIIRAVSVDAIAANLTAVLDSSLSFAVAPATAYADLETALKSIDSTATLEILGDGVMLATLGGAAYVAQSASLTTTGSSTSCPGFVTVNNQLALCDASGNRQVLYAAFADTDTLRDTFRAALSLPNLSVSNYGANGIYAANVDGTPYSLSPEISITSPPSSEAGNLWWSDATSGKIFIRYPSGQAQGFGVQ